MIDPKHEIPLTTAISASCPGRGSVAQALYNECLNVFKNTESRTSTVTKQRSVFNVQGGTHVTAIVTDNDLGLFVQLSGVVNESGVVTEGPFLVFGKKFLEESKNAQLSNTAVRLWR